MAASLLLENGKNCRTRRQRRCGRRRHSVFASWNRERTVTFLMLAVLQSVARFVSSSSSSTSGVATSSATAALPVSPVANWDPSWAASSAQGTTVVVSFGEDAEDDKESERRGRNSRAGCVVVLRSPTAPGAERALLHFDSSSSSSPPRGRSDSLEGITTPLRRTVDTGTASSDRVSGRWAWLPPSNLLCMTGFASDVDHLVSTVQSSADRHRLVYEGSDHVPSPLRLVHELAEALYDNAQGTQAGRPFGVQCLIVGQVPDWRPRFGIFTLDPSGGYRHWGVATAIGRGADRVRRNVYEQLQAKSGSRSGSSSSGDVPRTADEALRLALNATMVAFASDAPPSSSTASAAKTAAPNEDYAALLLLAAAASSSTTDADKIEPEMGIVDPNHLQALVQELREPWNAARA